MTPLSTSARNLGVLSILTGAFLACSTSSPLDRDPQGEPSSESGPPTDGSLTDFTADDGPGAEATESSGDGDGDGDGVCDRADPGWVGAAEDGDPVAHWVTVDYQGRVFELCSLGGKPIFVDIFTGWCSPCNDIAAWMSGSGTDSNGLDEAYKTAVDEGRLIWFEVMVQGWTSGVAATAADAQQWHDLYPHPTAVLVIDEQAQFYDYTGGWAYPTLRLIGHDFIWRDFDSLTEVLDAARN